ncbi:hypothetical protein AAZV13_15G134900 [Glycine max]
MQQSYSFCQFCNVDPFSSSFPFSNQNSMNSTTTNLHELNPNMHHHHKPPCIVTIVLCALLCHQPPPWNQIQPQTNTTTQPTSTMNPNPNAHRHGHATNLLHEPRSNRS